MIINRWGGLGTCCLVSPYCHYERVTFYARTVFMIRWGKSQTSVVDKSIGCGGLLVAEE